MPVIEKTYWKHKWAKNGDENGGAMAAAIEHMGKNTIIVHSQTPRNGRLWGSMTPAQFINLACDNRGLYEVITHFPHKVYFDIDAEGKRDSSYLETIKTTISKYFPSAEFAVSGSIKETKTSYHIILSNYIIANESDRLYMRHLCKFLQAEDSSFDWKVYTKNRNMKYVGQSKDDGRIQAIMENQDLKAHMITAFMPQFPLPFQTAPVEIQEHINIAHSKQPYDVTMLPKLNLTLPDDVNYLTLTATQIIELLPLDKSFDHNYTHLVARFCNANDVSIEIFLAWISKKHIPLTREHITKWKSHFSNISKYPPVSIERMKIVLKQFYPKIAKCVFFKKFESTFDIGTTTKIERLGQEHFIGTEKYSVFNIGMGGGKTAQTVDFLTDENSYCWIAPNRALANNTQARLETAHCDPTYYGSIDVKEKKTTGFTAHKRLVVVANSLHYIKTHTYRVVVIDEIETLIDKWFGTFMTKKSDNWHVFLNILRSAQKVILLDAFITTKTLNFLKQLDNKKIRVYARLNEPIIRNVHYEPHFESVIKNVISDLRAGLKLFIFYPYKEQYLGLSMAGLTAMLQSETGKTGIHYNADIDEEIKIGLRDVNITWKPYDFVITNMMITCGVNYDETDFDKEYVFVSQFSKPRDVAQITYRPRTISTNDIVVCFLGKMVNQAAWETDTHILNCPVYTSLIADVLIELKSPLRKTLQLFFTKANYLQHTSPSKIVKTIGTEMTDMFEKYSLFVGFTNIPDIDAGEAEQIQQRMFSCAATMLEKYQLQKYFFKVMFQYDAYDAVYADGVGVLERAWNGNKNVYFFKQIHRIISDENNVFNKIRTHNKFTGFFPTDIPKVKLTDDIIQQIFKEFDFRTVNSKSTPTKIVCSIYNAYFGKRLITTDHNADNHTSYSIDTEELDFYFDFYRKYHRTYIDTPNLVSTYGDLESVDDYLLHTDSTGADLS